MNSHSQQPSINSLSVGAQLFVKGIRTWASASRDQKCFGCVMKEHYEALDLEDALPLINEMMCFLCMASYADFSIHHPSHADLDDDEARLLSMMRATEERDRFAAIKHAEHFFRGPMTMTFLRISIAYSDLMALAGYSFLGTRPPLALVKDEMTSIGQGA